MPMNTGVDLDPERIRFVDLAWKQQSVALPAPPAGMPLYAAAFVFASTSFAPVARRTSPRSNTR